MTDRFAEFWQLYPRHEAKLAARKAYARVLKVTDHETVMKRLDIYKSAMWCNREIQALKSGLHYTSFYPLAATFLNREEWDRAEALEDESEPPLFAACKNAKVSNGLR